MSKPPRLLSGRRVAHARGRGAAGVAAQGAPDVVLLEIAEQRAAQWIAEIVAIASLRAKIRATAR